MGAPYPKQQMHRIACAKLTSQQIAAKLASVAAAGPKGRLTVSESGGKDVEAGYGLPAMRHARGEGRVRWSERRWLKADYLKIEAGWAIARLRFEPA